MRPAVALLVLIAALPTASADLRISGFAINLPGEGDDDAIELQNTGTEGIVLSDVTLADGEGVLSFSQGASIAPGARVVVALRAEPYTAAARRPPDFALDLEGIQRLEEPDAGFSLSQRGDELFLRQGSRLVDAVVWGDSDYQGAGWVGPPVSSSAAEMRWFPRIDRPDSDTRADWESPQQPRLGWRAAAPARAHPAEGAAYTLPDQGRHMVSGLIGRAESSLRLNVYELRDVGIAQDLLARMAARPGLKVDVLVDEQPVGLDAEERLVRDRILHELEDAGARVRLFTHARYPYDHAKYLVVDGRYALVQTENLVPGALPVDARNGNRGWGLLLDSPSFAAGLAGVFDDDFALDPHGARALGPGEEAPVPLPAFVTGTPAPRFVAVPARGFNATLVVGPEAHLAGDDPLLALIAQAKHEILVEQLRVPPTWRDPSGREWANDYLGALLEAARRGVRVRLLLDGHFLDGSGNDNAATQEFLRDAARLLPIEVRLLQDSEAGVLHVKGVVADRRVSWVGSMNWNLNSVAQNREVSAIVDAPAFAELFAEAFGDDWGHGERAPEPGHPTPGAAFAATVIALALLGLRMPMTRRR